MANTKVSGDLIQDGAISQNHLNENHGITTTDIGEGTALYYTDARVANYLTTNSYATEGYVNTATANAANWDAAFSWGDHSLVGYLTTETDPVYLASSWYTTTNNAANWDIAFSWGNHATQSYATESFVTTAVSNLVDAAPTTLDTLNELAAALGDDPNFATTVSASIGTKWTQDNAKISNWDTAYSWGNHASVGYLTSFTETDPTVPSHVKSITTTNISNWNTAYGWGNHASAGYASASSLSSYLPLTGGTLSGTLISGTASPTGSVIGGVRSYGSTNAYMGASDQSGRTAFFGVDASNYAMFGALTNHDTVIRANNTEYLRVHTGGYTTMSGSSRAPIFYDSNDTGYYVDPASVNSINQMFVKGSANGWSIITGTSSTARTVTSDGNRSSIIINSDLYPQLYLNAYTQAATNSTHGPVFSMTGSLSSGGYRRWGMGIAQANPNELSFGWFDNNDNPHYGVGINWGESQSARMWIDTGGNLFSRGSMRSPIFYDYNDTNYYLDPNGTSRTNVLTSFSVRNNYDVSVDHTYGMYFSNAGGESYSIFRESGAWSHPYPDLRIAFHTGIKLGAYFGYNGIRFYNNSDMVTQTASIGDGDNNLRGYYDIIAYASDKRLKEKIEPITDAIDKVKKLNGFTYNWNKVGEEYGWEPPKERESGVFAQEVQEVLPEAVRTAPFDQTHDEDGNMHSKSGENFLTVKYEKLVPLLIEAIKEQQQQIEELKSLVNK